MGGYYYTVSSLPRLSFDSGATMAEEDFLFLCQNTLGGGDWALVKAARLRGPADTKTGNRTLDSWFAGEQSMRAELAKLRAAKKGAETESYNRYGAYSLGIVEAARQAFGEASPLDAETAVLRALWALLEELETGHLFDVDRLIVYYLKMQLLDLKNKRNKAAGEKNFSALYGTIANKNPSWRV
ncbi:MAG: DUF2764 domain-containing protein [Spirochaetia bacterium]|nr:DUF2764 domain-containing protein [Spirochaetia bacterium]